MCGGEGREVGRGSEGVRRGGEKVGMEVRGVWRRGKGAEDGGGNGGKGGGMGGMGEGEREGRREEGRYGRVSQGIVVVLQTSYTEQYTPIW